MTSRRNLHGVMKGICKVQRLAWMVAFAIIAFVAFADPAYVGAVPDSNGTVLDDPARLVQARDKALIREVTDKVVVVYNGQIGSGVIVSPTGDILTNEHVVGERPFVRVRFSDGVEKLGAVIARDEIADLALVKVHTTRDLPFMTIAEDDALEQGDTVYLCGHPFGEEFVCMKGIVSKRWTTSPNLGSQFYGEWISDAPVFPGFSGGAAFNLQGDLVGLPHARAPGRIVPAGISILIPPGLLQKAHRDFIQYGALHWAHLGIQVQDMSQAVATRHGVEPFHGVLVRATLPEEHVDDWLEGNDILTHFGDARIRRIDDLKRAVRVSDPGDVVEVTVLRHGRTMAVSVELGEGTLAALDSDASVDLDVHDVYGFTFHFDAELNACVVDSVDEQSSASHAGLLPGAIIKTYDSAVRLNSRRRVALFWRALGSLDDGDGLRLHVSNDGDNTRFETMLYNPTRRMWL